MAELKMTYDGAWNERVDDYLGYEIPSMWKPMISVNNTSCKSTFTDAVDQDVEQRTYHIV